MAAAPEELKVVLAQPRGFCAGVERAIDIVERALSFAKNVREDDLTVVVARRTE